MAEEKQEAAPEEGKEKAEPKKSNKKLFIIAGAAVLLIAGGFFAYTQFFGAKDKGAESHKKEEAKATLISLDPFVLNLTEQGRFLKVTMQLELTDMSFQQMVMDKVPQLRDAIITLLSSKSVESVSSPEGKLQVKDEIILRANQAVGKNAFKNLYFTEFVMQ